MNVKIGNKIIGEGKPCFISFESGATYTNLKEAKEMIKIAAESGADAIKFQTFTTGDADRIMGDKNSMVEFKTIRGNKQELVYDALKRRELKISEWEELVKFSKNNNIMFISAPYFSETVDLLKKLKIDAIKISKGDINNVLLIDLMSKTKLPIILDAREKIQEIKKAIEICEKNKNKNIIIMHCPSGYPAESKGVHLNAISYLRKKFRYPIAYSDHSPGDFMNYAAISLGASMLEKTITKNKKIEKVEHFMSLEFNELKKFVSNIRELESAMGDSSILNISRVEDSAKRSIVAKQFIRKNQKIDINLIDFKRYGNIGISCSKGFEILKKTANKDIEKGTILEWFMLK